MSPGDWQDALHERGLRATPARSAVLDVLSDTADHLSGDQIATQVAEASPSIHRATVFRTLDTLIEAGLITHVHLPHGATTYHMRRASERMHLHLSCRSCGAIIDVDPDVMDGVVDGLRARYGFELQPSHTALSGRCATCADPDDI